MSACPRGLRLRHALSGIVQGARGSRCIRAGDPIIMTTAISLTVLVLTGVIIYASWGLRAIAGGTNVFLVLAAAPVIFVAIPMLFCVLWFTLAWIFRSHRPREVRIGF